MNQMVDLKFATRMHWFNYFITWFGGKYEEYINYLSEYDGRWKHN